MSERGKPVISSETRTNQARAADPSLSIWVSANAGSGKTYVLTRRVLRLLLAGALPQSILCLTYTKAAAAEMRARVAGALAQWATMAEGELVKELKDVLGTAPLPALVERARTLFAQALETPGGLKIVTIHAFCESVLHRFPLEAGVPFDFKVIEDEERTRLLAATRVAVLAEGLRGGKAALAVDTLLGLLSDFQIEEAITLALADGRKLKAVLAKPASAKANLRRQLGVAEPRPLAQITGDIVGKRLLDAGDVRRLLALGGKSVTNRLAGLDVADPDPEAWWGAFLTDKDQTPVANFPGKAVEKADFALCQRTIAEADRLAALMMERRVALVIARSEALLDVVAAVSARYQEHKRARSQLDFDDLVEKLGNLLENPEIGPWVQYKLDTGIDHILVDESQDTNPDQWRVVKAIANEFFDGAGAVDRLRSLFAVGDQKQSIYSFQGAEPTLFAETGALFERRAAEVSVPFRRVPLHTSFRTLPEILAAVDKVTDLPGMQDNLLELGKVHHDTARPVRGGTVTLWPPVQQQPAGNGAGEWPLEPASGGERTAPRQVAERIAREIRGWIDAKRPLANRGVIVRPEHIMILVQSRGAVFQEVIRALRLAGLPTPGADRLSVSDHIAVLDLLALCDVLLNPADDLQLAALLRSPLFDIDEDDLYALAQPREGKPLWRALRDCTIPRCKAAHDTLFRWRSELDFERPFEFLSQVLYAEGGLRRFHARMGAEVDEVFAELLTLALDHEQDDQPSLQGFVASIRASNVSIKRELGEAGTGIRVMTVHGAKGLEAPIVILADAAAKPQGNQISRPVYLLADAPGPLLVHASGSRGHVPQSQAVKDMVESNLAKEYWRKLYVAMTRAEDELYVTGALTPGRKAEEQLKGTWYEAIETALREDSESKRDEAGNEIALIYPRERIAPPALGRLSDVVPLADQPLHLDAQPAPAVVPLVTPSSVKDRVAPIAALDSLAEQVRDAGQARREGIALHALLQHLGRIGPAERPGVAARALETLLPDVPGEHAALAERAISILTQPGLSHLFGPHSRAEVPFLVEARRDGQPIRLAGRIDRLVVDDSGVTVVDYKSDASVPGGPGDVPGNYLTQLGLYALVAGQLFPGRDVRAAILWTRLESLMNLPQDLLAAATRGFTMR